MDMFDKMNIYGLNYAMDVSAKKNQVISENIANVDTPNYKAKDLNFEKAMKEYFSGGNNLPLKVTHKNHISPQNTGGNINSLIYEQNNPSLRNDGNDVNLDYEMSEMASNAVKYSMFSQITGTEFARLKSAIAGR